MVAAMCLPLSRSSQPTAGPISSATAASIAGRRSAANEAPVRSKKWDMDSV